jgi:hypothetical protein
MMSALQRQEEAMQTVQSVPRRLKGFVLATVAALAFLVVIRVPAGNAFADQDFGIPRR